MPVIGRSLWRRASGATEAAPVRLRLAFLGDSNSIHLRRWLAFFAERGHEVSLLVPSAEEVAPELDKRVAVHRFWAWPRLPIRGASGAATALAIRLLTRRLRPHVLHAHYLTRYGWAARMSGFRPYVISVWGSDVLVRPMPPRDRIWARRSLSGAALVTGASQDLIRAAIELGAKPELTRVVQFGVDPNLFRPGPAPAELRRGMGLDGRRVVLSPRGLSGLYRHELAIRALVELPEDVVLVLVRHRPDPAYAAGLEALIGELGLGDRVRFAPAVEHEHMVDLIRLADVVVSMPRTDAFPVTALEAMACGIPIVLGDLPSAHEGLDAVDPSAVVPGDDPASVAAALRLRLDLDPGGRAELGARLREAAIVRGDVTRSLLEMERRYEQLAQGRRPS